MEVRREDVTELSCSCCRGRSSPRQFTPGGYYEDPPEDSRDREIDEARQDIFD